MEQPVFSFLESWIMEHDCSYLAIVVPINVWGPHGLTSRVNDASEIDGASSLDK